MLAMERIEKHEGLYWYKGEGFKDLREAKAKCFNENPKDEFIKILEENGEVFLAKRSIFEWFNK